MLTGIEANKKLVQDQMEKDLIGHKMFFHPHKSYKITYRYF